MEDEMSAPQIRAQEPVVAPKTALASETATIGEMVAAVDAVRTAGEIVRSRFERPIHAREKRQSHADATDYVTELDVAVEALIMLRLRTAYPDYGFLSEEDGTSCSQSTRWIIDPIDGTLNLIAGLPFFAISIALERAGQIVLGVVYLPMTGELFCARVGGGAFCNDREIRVGNKPLLRDAMLGCTIDKRPEPRATILRQLDRLGVEFKSLICLQTSALALCLLAQGKIDAIIDYGSYWDFAAAQLIASEAGAIVSDWSGSPLRDGDSYFLGANPALHRELAGGVARPKLSSVKVADELS
jgi:myo-inositol-1(or 4)-monophosphatase